jgi:hypothetical protein
MMYIHSLGPVSCSQVRVEGGEGTQGDVSIVQPKISPPLQFRFSIEFLSIPPESVVIGSDHRARLGAYQTYGR